MVELRFSLQEGLSLISSPSHTREKGEGRTGEGKGEEAGKGQISGTKTHRTLESKGSLHSQLGCQHPSLLISYTARVQLEHKAFCALSDPEAFASTAPLLGFLVVRLKSLPFTYLSSYLRKMEVCEAWRLVCVPRADCRGRQNNSSPEKFTLTPLPTTAAPCVGAVVTQDLEV